MNKTFHRLALPYKTIFPNSSFILIEPHQQILADYEDLVRSYSISSKPVWLTNVLSVVLPSDKFHGFLMSTSSPGQFLKNRRGTT